jgi:hypothetical protein
LAREAEVLGENLPQCRFVHHKPHMLPGREPGSPRWEASVYSPELGHGLTEGFEFESRYALEFSLPHVVQTGSGVHPTSYPMGIGGKVAKGRSIAQAVSRWLPIAAAGVQYRV